MSKQHKFNVGDTVKHDYAEPGVIGEIHDVRDHPNGYDYFVRFINEDDETHGAVPVAKDWFKEKVLIKVEGIQD